MFSVAVRSSLARNFESNLVLVSFRDMMSYVHVFQLFSTIKVNLVAKIMQSAHLCVIFHVKHKKITISRGFNLLSNSW